MRMASSRPYAECIRQVIGHLANANPEYRHPFMIEREVKRVGYVVVSSDRGLCGGLNTNLFKALVKDMTSNREQGVEIDLCVIGSKGAAFFRNFGGNVVAAISHLGEEPSINDLIGSVKVMLDAYLEGRIDRLSVVSNKFVNTMTQKPTVEQLVPLVATPDEGLKHHWDYLYEPDAKQLLDAETPEKLNSQPIGTGPFVFERYAKDAQVRFAANPHYWGGKPALDRLLLAIVLLAILGKLTDALLGLFERWAQARWGAVRRT